MNVSLFYGQARKTIKVYLYHIFQEMEIFFCSIPGIAALSLQSVAVRVRTICRRDCGLAANTSQFGYELFLCEECAPLAFPAVYSSCANCFWVTRRCQPFIVRFRTANVFAPYLEGQKNASVNDFEKWRTKKCVYERFHFFGHRLAACDLLKNH